MSMREAFRQAGIDVPEQPERSDEGTSPRNRQGVPRGGGGRGGRDDGQGRGGSGRPSGPAPQFPAEYFGTDGRDNRYLLPIFVSREKMDTLARRMVGSDAHPKLTTGQLRRFYNYCRSIERRLNVENCSWEQVAADFEKLAFHAQYARSTGKIPQEFQQFVDDNVGRVNATTGRHREAFLKGFLPHFEALVGFGAAHLRQN